MTPAIFLDRDGTIIEEVGYLSTTEQLTIFEWSVEALGRLRQAGFKLVIVTNQAGVARGFFDEARVAEVNAFLCARLAEAGIRIDAVYYCPHHPDGTVPAYRTPCGCRKPQPGMVDRACEDLGIDVARSFVVGDRWSDVELARAVGAEAVLVKSGYGRHALAAPKPGVDADAVVDTLLDAAHWILERRVRASS
ncbi:MAG: HAD family hydrolase [Vicinamibacterales bacterium]